MLNDKSNTKESIYTELWKSYKLPLNNVVVLFLPTLVICVVIHKFVLS